MAGRRQLHAARRLPSKLMELHTSNTCGCGCRPASCWQQTHGQMDSRTSRSLSLLWCALFASVCGLIVVRGQRGRGRRAVAYQQCRRGPSRCHTSSLPRAAAQTHRHRVAGGWGDDRPRRSRTPSVDRRCLTVSATAGLPCILLSPGECMVCRAYTQGDAKFGPFCWTGAGDDVER